MKIEKVTKTTETIEVLDEDIVKDFMNCSSFEDCDGCLATIDLGGFTMCSLLSCYKREFVNNLLIEIEKL